MVGPEAVFYASIANAQVFETFCTPIGGGITVLRTPRVVKIVRRTFKNDAGGRHVGGRSDRQQKKTFFAAAKLREIFMLLRGNKG